MDSGGRVQRSPAGRHAPGPRAGWHGRGGRSRGRGPRAGQLPLRDANRWLHNAALDETMQQRVLREAARGRSAGLPSSKSDQLTPTSADALRFARPPGSFPGRPPPSSAPVSIEESPSSGAGDCIAGSERWRAAVRRSGTSAKRRRSRRAPARRC